MMHRHARVTLLAVLAIALIALAMPASADIAPPEPPKPPRPPKPVRPDKGVELPLTIKLHDDSKPMKLELPAKVLAVKAAAEVEGDAATAGASRTVIAAVMLSFAAVAGGLWFARKRGRGAGMMAAALAISAAGVWTSQAWANRAPIPDPPEPRPVPVPAEKQGLTIRIEGSARGDQAVLHISEAQLKSIVLEVFKENKGGVGRGEGSAPPPPPGSAPRSAPPSTGSAPPNSVPEDPKPSPRL